MTLVVSTQVNLRCHVGHCSKLGLHQARAISPAHWRGKTEIRNLEQKVVVKQKILRFEVSVSEPSVVHALKSCKQLLEVVSSLRLREGATHRDEIEEFTAAGKLKNDVLDQLLALSWVDLIAFTGLDKLENIGVIELPEYLKLTVDTLLEFCISVDDLNCIAFAIAVSSHLDFAGDSASKRSSQFVFIS